MNTITQEQFDQEKAKINARFLELKGNPNAHAERRSLKQRLEQLESQIETP